MPAGAAASTGLYHGTARALLPTAHQALYDRRAAPYRVHHPSRGKRAGWLNGWDASYRDFGSIPPVADITVYVYQGVHGARAAFRNACRHCRVHRFHKLDLSVKGAMTPPIPGNPFHCYALVGHTRNIYIAAITCGRRSYSVKRLKYDAAYEVGWISQRPTVLDG